MRTEVRLAMGARSPGSWSQLGHFLTTGTHQLTCRLAWLLVAPEASGHLGLHCPGQIMYTLTLAAQFPCLFTKGDY